MGVLQTGVFITRVRAAITVASPDAAVVYVLPVAAVKHIHIVLGAELDSIGFNKFFHEVFVVVDQTRLLVSKGVVDAIGVADETTYVLFKKGSIEFLNTSEQRTFSMAKSLSDVVDVTDDFMGEANLDDEQVMFLSKSLPVEQQVALDRAVSAVSKPAADNFYQTDVQETEFGKGLVETQQTAETKHFDIEKSLVDTVDAGDEFNAVALTDDGEVMVFGKTLADEWTYSDAVSVQPEKVFEDTVARPTDQLDYIEVGKGIEDVPVTSEAMQFDTAKDLQDSFGSFDEATRGISYTIKDWANQGEGPNQYNTYALSYFQETYALEGFPALDITKGIFDTVHTTDDFFGAANTDDDETMQFGKTLGEVFHYADYAAVGLNKALAILFATSDATAFGLGKSLADTSTTSETLTRGVSKPLNDSSIALDSSTRGTGKGIDDSASTAEYNSFAISKSLSDTVITTDDFLGNANADDDVTMLFNKSISDSFTKSDLAALTAGKGLADSASTSESGSIVWTDHWPIGYTDTTSSVYVGNQRTF